MIRRPAGLTSLLLTWSPAFAAACSQTGDSAAIVVRHSRWDGANPLSTTAFSSAV
ncbi:hypothetical protein amrb99_85680 [Actinomadura sp. RB99]|nr:hypothetical protein [Actinomadura sp. RB99]